MKLLIVTSLADDKQEVSNLLQQAGIAIFNVLETTAYKRNNGTPNPLNNWFGNDNLEFDSIIFFSFTDETVCQSVFELIDQRNRLDRNQFPIHSFTLEVESFNTII